MTDEAVVSAQIGRPARVAPEVVVRCALGLPVVARMPAQLPDGEPFPTRHWLTCPLAHLRVARLESAGGVASWDARLRDEPGLRAAMDAVHARARAERGEADGPRGLAGSRGGVKCLHAQLADGLVHDDNPVGTAVRALVEPLDCTHPCVVDTPDGARRNPSWRAPT